MTYNFEQIHALEHPYQELGNPESLIEHREELNKLSEEQKIAVATKMVHGCPHEEMTGFYHAIEALKTPQDDEETFSSYLAEAYEVKKRISSLTDPRNKKPHLLLIGKEFNGELYAKFNALTLQVVDKNERAIAIRLAQSTPTESRSAVSKNLHDLFRGTEFASKVNQVFTLSRNIEQYLLGSNPYEFYNSRDFNADACLEFPELFECIKKRESSIATNLALTTPPNERSKIAQSIQSIRSQGELASRTAAAFALRRQIEMSLLGENPELFFTSSEFQVDHCLEFAGLFTILLKGHEQSIGEKLARLDSQTLSKINRQLEGINPSASNQDSPFRLIANAMLSTKDSASKESKKSSTALKMESSYPSMPTPNSSTRYRGTIFGGPTLQQPGLKTIQEVDSDVENEDEESKEYSCFNCFGLC